MNRCIPATSEGTGNWVTAVVFCGSAQLLEGGEEQLVRVHHVLTGPPRE